MKPTCKVLCGYQIKSYQKLYLGQNGPYKKNKQTNWEHNLIYT